MSQGYYAYIRVSTAKQGKTASLPEQQNSIQSFAKSHGISIIHWFEEKETAAKRGRPVFGKMLDSLKAGEAHGVIIHKIDRGARNLKDWADLGELIDAGVDVKFANESLDMSSRGGRLSADIQAVVAADYIRNLKEETRKGIYGRLKQGLYPWPAPIGYLNTGSGNAKEVDQVRAPLIKRIFELYATGGYSLSQLRRKSEELGFRSHSGKVLSRNSFSLMLNNPFYMGIIRIKRTGETFKGIHTPIISSTLFERVQSTLRRKENKKKFVHEFLFRGLLKCAGCGYSMIGEKQKGHVYYRCHRSECPTKGIREEEVESSIRNALSPLSFPNRAVIFLWSEFEEHLKTIVQDKKLSTEGYELRLGQLSERMNRLTDALIDGLIDKEVFNLRKETLLREKVIIKESIQKIEAGVDPRTDAIKECLELSFTALQRYNSVNMHERRELLNIASSNLTVSGKNVAVELLDSIEVITNHLICAGSCPQRYTPRTLGELFAKLVKFFDKKYQKEK
ncbi:MAG: recombinase family protein [Bacteroidota bacterium]